MLSDDGKESNTAKGLNTATEFNEFKDTLFTKKFSDTKWKEFKVKNINLEHAKSTTNRYSVLMIKDLFQMMGFIHQRIFIKEFEKIDSHR